MTTDDEIDAPWLAEDPQPVMVGDGPRATPFMPGILVASLVRRGVPFPLAYAAARQLEQRLQGVRRVEPRELADAVRHLLGSHPDDPHSVPEREVQVRAAGTSLPFSKGVLSQSLLAAAIDPRDAFDIAREIERDLLGGDRRDIDRSELRAVAHRVLRKRMGDEAAARYLVWRRFEAPEKPVFLLLGGTSGVGKTTLALEVARRLGIGRVLSTDSIRQVMRLMISPELLPSIHASSYDAYRTLERTGSEPVDPIEGYRAQASTVAVGVRASLDRGVDENENLVIDGVSLLPGVVGVARYAQSAVVVFCIVATLDENVLRDRFVTRAAKQRQRGVQRYVENFDEILAIQRHLVAEAQRRNLLIIDNVDLDASARQILAHLLDDLRARGAADAPR